MTEREKRLNLDLDEVRRYLMGEAHKCTDKEKALQIAYYTYTIFETMDFLEGKERQIHDMDDSRLCPNCKSPYRLSLKMRFCPVCGKEIRWIKEGYWIGIDTRFKG